MGVTLATVAGNALSYALLVVAARWLAPGQYSEVVTLLNVLLVGSVPSLALQAVAARRTKIGDNEGLLRLASTVGVAAAAAAAVASPALAAFLHLSSVAGVLVVALAFPFIALQGTVQGIFQGLERFRAVAVVTFLGIFGRSAIGLAGLALFGTAVGTVSAVTLGVVVAAALAVMACPHLRARPDSAHQGMRTLLAEVTHASHAYGVFMVLTTADVLLARHVLPASAAGAYAAGSVLTRISLWLPQSIATVLFPSLTDHARHRILVARAVTALALLGAVSVGGGWLLHDHVWAFVAGHRYAGRAGEVWLFILLGACLAITQFLLVAGLAVRNVVLTVVLWLTVAVEAASVLSLRAPTVHSVVATVCAVNLVAVGVAVVIRTRTTSRPVTDTPAG